MDSNLLVFIFNKYNSWFSKQISAQLALGTRNLKVTISAKLSDIKQLRVQWIVYLYNHKCKKKHTIINGFKSAGVTEAIQSAQEIVTKAENPFRR